ELPEGLTATEANGGEAVVRNGTLRMLTDTAVNGSYAWVKGPDDLPADHGVLIKYRFPSPEMLTNSEFTSGADDWHAYAGATLTWDEGRGVGSTPRPRARRRPSSSADPQRPARSSRQGRHTGRPPRSGWTGSETFSSRSAGTTRTAPWSPRTRATRSRSGVSTRHCLSRPWHLLALRLFLRACGCSIRRVRPT